MTETIKIGGELENMATGNIVADANAIMYRPIGKLEKTLAQINNELIEAIGTGGSVDSRISAAVATETTRAQAAEADRYTKSETYNKTELNNLITTPNQQYVTVTATDQTTAATDVLPATGSADTVYRVGNWDGTQYSEVDYAEYAWDGSAYVLLSTKSQVGEVYDISANHSNQTYADLTAALGTDGANIPQNLRKGGMSVKFVQSSDNNYAQFRCMAQNFTTDVTKWQGVDDEPTAGSNNLVKSGGIKSVINQNAKSIASKEGKNVLMTNVPLVAGSTYRIIVWAESTIECTQFSVSTPLGNKWNQGITSYDGTPIILEKSVSTTSTDGEFFVWISNNQSVGTKVYCKLDSFPNKDVDSIDEVNKLLISATATMGAGTKRCNVSPTPLSQDSGAIIHIESPVDIIKVNFVENTTTWESLGTLTGTNIKDKIFLMPAGCSYIQIDTTENVQEDTDVHISILYGGLYETIYTEQLRIDNELSILNEDITRNAITLLSVEGENIFSDKVDFIKDTTYKITIWSDATITCTQFSLLSSIVNIENSGITSYDGTPIAAIKKATSTIKDGYIKAWISNNQSAGAKIYCRIETIMSAEVDEKFEQIGGNVLLDSDGSIPAGSKRKSFGNLTAMQTDTPATVYITGTEKIVHVNFVENTTTWRSLGTIDANPLVRKSFTLPAGCTYIQFDTANNLEEAINFHVLIEYGESTQQQINESLDSVVVGKPIINRNQDKIPALFSMCRYNGLGHTSMQPANTRPFQDAEFVLVADHHGDSLALNNAVDLLNGVACIDALIHCGDFGGGIYSPTIGPDMYNILRRANKPYLAVIGNHDVGTSIVIEQCCDHATAYHDYIKPLVDNGTLVVGEYQDGKCYYYHDFTERKLRMIFLYEYDDPMEIDETIWKTIPYDATLPLIGANGTSYVTGDQVRLENYTAYCFEAKQNVTLSIVNNWSETTRPAYKIPRGIRVIRQEQAQWFLGTLASTPEGYDVIVVTHMPFSQNRSKVDCEFSISLNVVGDVGTILDDFIADAVNAYVNKSNFSKTVEVSTYGLMQGFSYNVEYDFTQAKGNFIGFIGGHNHCDLVLKHQTYNLYGVYPTAAKTWTYGSMDYREDIAHSNSDGIAYDCLTVISPASDRIMLAKVGATKTIDGRTREYQLLNQNEQ